MYVEPNTNIRILRQAPVDPEYRNTLLFQTDAQQRSYFMGLTKYNLANYTYQRVQKGVCRVGIIAENLYDCNYMMFQNNAFGDKWFYAFIDNVEYINNTTSEIRFTIDVLQTWRHFLDWEFNSVFVEREHSATDIIGENITPESIETGEYVFNDYTNLKISDGSVLSEYAIVVAIVEVVGEGEEQHPVAQGQLYDGIYGGAKLYAYSADETGVQLVNDKIDEYVEAPDSILCMYMCPAILLGSDINSGDPINYGSGGTSNSVHLDGILGSETLDGYLPKNKKLYTYPYNFLHIDNANGEDLALRYEFFNDLKPEAVLYGCITQPIQVVLKPSGYKGLRRFDELGGHQVLQTESLTLQNYPMCSWNVDAWEAWVAQNSIPTMLGLISRGVGIGAMASSKKVPYAGIISGTVGATAGLLSEMYGASIRADISKGNFSCGNANFSRKFHQFYGGRCSITHQVARIIDDYFTKFGYATNLVKTPNLFTRPNWNYIKTSGCTIVGAIPSDDEKKICEIFDNGITCWHNPNTFGDYSQNNSPA